VLRMNRRGRTCGALLDGGPGARREGLPADSEVLRRVVRLVRGWAILPSLPAHAVIEGVDGIREGFDELREDGRRRWMREVFASGMKRGSRVCFQGYNPKACPSAVDWPEILVAS